jgi:hypothetical protein
LFISRGGGAVNALASRSTIEIEGLGTKETSKPVGLWLAGVRIPSPAPLKMGSTVGFWFCFRHVLAKAFDLHRCAKSTFA